MNVPKVKYEIIYNGKDITNDILPFVLSFTYSDKSQGEADEIQIVLEDVNDLWKNNWYPSKGDSVSAKIFHPLQGTLDCGTFTIDEVTGEGSDGGDTFTLKGLAAGVNKKVRTKTSYAHENKTLREIANHIATKHGFTVEGSIKDVRISRVTQYRESDLKFLKRLSFEYGYTFNVRDQKLIFTDVFELEKKSSALEIFRSEMISYSITDKTSGSYKDAKVSYHNPRKKQTISHTQKESEAAYQGAKVDTLELRMRSENEQQAEIKSRVALYRANSKQQEGSVSIPGNIYAVAGNNCSLYGIGNFSGLYYLGSTTHNVAPDGGYTSDLSVKRVGMVEKEKQKQKSKDE